jgi:hypothetical protein
MFPEEITGCSAQIRISASAIRKSIDVDFEEVETEGGSCYQRDFQRKIEAVTMKHFNQVPFMRNTDFLSGEE